MRVTAKMSLPHHKKLKNRLYRIRSFTDSGFKKEAMTVLEDSVSFLKDNTPRSDNPKEHIADGWQLHTIGGKAKDREAFLAVIFNSQIMNRAGKIYAKAWLKVKGIKQSYTLLHILEYGSKRHDIFPWKKKALHFFTREGKEKFVKHVAHPGTKPYGMIRKAKARLYLKMNKLALLWIARIKEFKG